LDEVRDVLLYVAVFERQSHLFARGIVADAYCRGDVGEVPQAALGIVDALLFEILELVARSLPVPVPPAGRLFQHLDRRLVLVARCRQVDLRLLQLRLILPLLVAHDHVRLRQEALDLQTVLLVSVACLVHRRCLLHLQLEQLLNPILHDLSPLLHSPGEGLQRLFQLRLHLLCYALVCLPHGFDLGSDDIARQSQGAGFAGPEGLPREVQELSRVLIFYCCSCGVEVLEFVVGDFGRVHAVEHGTDASVIFAPEVVGDWIC
jgi:hypothetical protein